MRIGLVLEYDGTDYCGWQIQPDRPTIQGTVERSLATILGEPVRVEAAGRTDAGVHARGQVAAFRSARPVDVASLQRSLNALCAPDIVARRLGVVTEGFDPRRDARSRTYEYTIDNAPWASPFTRRYAWHIHRPLDVAAMQGACGALLGEHDFSSFQAADCDAENPVRRVQESTLERSGAGLVYRITATAFLRHMVRTVVGTLVEIGRGERGADLAALIAARDRTLGGATAPAHGLCLTNVVYDDAVFVAGA